MKSCYYYAVVGVQPDCDHECEGCEFWLTDPEPKQEEQ